MAEIVNRYQNDVNSYLKENFKSPKSEVYKEYITEKIKLKEITSYELKNLKDYIEMKKDIVISEDDKLQLMDLSNSLNNNQNNSNYIPDSNDNFKAQDIVFAGGSIQENIKVIKNFKFDMKDENRLSPIAGEVNSLGNNMYDISLSRIDGGEIGKIKVLYNPYGNSIQIFDEYRNRLIGEQVINMPRRGHRHGNMNSQIGLYPSTQFNVKLDNNGPLVNINLAFPNR